MADITKCKGTGCPWRTKCFRVLAKDFQWQSYFSLPPLDTETKTCKYFLPMEFAPESLVGKPTKKRKLAKKL